MEWWQGVRAGSGGHLNKSGKRGIFTEKAARSGTIIDTSDNEIMYIFPGCKCKI